jgi:hypothetical protein
MPVSTYRYGTGHRRRGKAVNHVDAERLHQLAREVHPDAIVIEQQTAMPKQSMQSTGTSFANYGLVLSLRLVGPVHLVHPATWKAALKVPRDKKAATQRCAELFPGQKTPERDGPAEALMLALYWRRLMEHGETAGDAGLRQLGAGGKAKGLRSGLLAGTAGDGSAPGRLDRAAPGH